MQGYQSNKSRMGIAALIFSTAIGIMKYTDKVADPKFKAVGEQMLDTVEKFLCRPQAASRCATGIIKID